MDIAGIVSLVENIHGLAGCHANRMPRGETSLPRIVIRQYDGDVEYQMDGTAGVEHTFVEVRTYGKNPTQAAAVVRAVRSVLDNYSGTLNDGTVVLACFHRGQSDDPYVTSLDAKNDAVRTVLRYEVINRM